METSQFIDQLAAGEAAQAKDTLTDIDTDFDTIELACAEFTQVADVPYRIIITNKEAVTGATMSITDTGASNLGTVTISDLTLFPASILKCKTINTNKNYSTIANITEREEFDLDLSGVTITQFEYPMISHGDFFSSKLHFLKRMRSDALHGSSGMNGHTDLEKVNRIVVFRKIHPNVFVEGGC